VALLWAATGWAVMGFLAALLVLVSGGHVQRYQFMSVLSGSMVPTLGVGDLVVAEVVTPDQLEAGELATFREPRTGKLITHRVQSIIWHGELADVVTRGDANKVGEDWSVSAADRVGQVVLRVPKVGYVVGMLATPAGQLGLAGLGALLGLWILVVLWRPQRTDDAEAPSPRHPSPDRPPQQRTDAGTASSREGPRGPAAAVAAATGRPLVLLDTAAAQAAFRRVADRPQTGVPVQPPRRDEPERTST
jgi:signal peptidase